MKKSKTFYPKEVVTLPRPRGSSYDVFASVIDQIGSVVLYRDHDDREFRIINADRLRHTERLIDGTYKRIPDKKKKSVKRFRNKIVY